MSPPCELYPLSGVGIPVGVGLVFGWVGRIPFTDQLSAMHPGMTLWFGAAKLNALMGNLEIEAFSTWEFAG